MLNAKTFTKIMQRDGGCYHCGENIAVAPNHRANRGMGGSKLLDNPSNLVVLCSEWNGLIESDDKVARAAKAAGWKVSRYESPLIIPIYDYQTQLWYLLDDEYGRTPIGEKKDW